MAEIGLFPLELVLLPTERVPLHIFEDRYKELIGECLARDGEFGLVFADEHGLREIGTLAAVADVLERFPDGRLNILVEGRERFRLVELTARPRRSRPPRSSTSATTRRRRRSGDVERALEQFARLKELTSVGGGRSRPRRGLPVVPARSPRRLRRGGQAAASRAALGGAADARGRRAARERRPHAWRSSRRCASAPRRTARSRRTSSSWRMHRASASARESRSTRTAGVGTG